MKDIDHTPPVAGPNRTFERNNEGRPAKTDGGPRDAEDAPADDPDSDEEAAADDPDSDEEAEPFGRKLKDMDHSSPVEGANRTFERGRRRDVRDGQK